MRRNNKNEAVDEVPDVQGEMRTIDGWPLVKLVGDDQPRLLDLDIARKADLAKPRDIRTTIKEHQTELEEFGPLEQRRHDRRYEIRPGVPMVQETTAFFLTEAQAHHLFALLNTPKAARARVLMTKVFMAWKDGTLPPPPEPGGNSLVDQARFMLRVAEKHEILVKEQIEIKAEQKRLAEEIAATKAAQAKAAQEAKEREAANDARLMKKFYDAVLSGPSIRMPRPGKPTVPEQETLRPVAPPPPPPIVPEPFGISVEKPRLIGKDSARIERLINKAAREAAARIASTQHAKDRGVSFACADHVLREYIGRGQKVDRQVCVDGIRRVVGRQYGVTITSGWPAIEARFMKPLLAAIESEARWAEQALAADLSPGGIGVKPSNLKRWPLEVR